jgi:hypothetical protein
MATDHVTLNVGGRLFYTTRGTLEFSRAGFFEALLRRWNHSSANVVASPPVQVAPPDETSQERPAKRLRGDSESHNTDPFVSVDNETCQATITMCSPGGTAIGNNTEEESSPLFIDRDPDAFEDVLYFMRTQQIKPSTSIDVCKVKQLSIEAEFLGYEILAQACETRLTKIVELIRPPPKTIAYSDTAILGNRGNVNRPRKEIKVPEGQVIYIEFASIWGLETLEQAQRVNLGFYRRTSDRLPAGQRQIRSITIICSGKRSMENPFAQRIGICISPKDKNDKIGIICAPVVTGVLWQVHYWIGPPSQIPQLGGGTSDQRVPERLDPLSLLLPSEESEPRVLEDSQDHNG